MFYIYPRNVIIIAHAYDFPQAFQFIFFRLRKVERLSGSVRKKDKFLNFFWTSTRYVFIFVARISWNVMMETAKHLHPRTIAACIWRSMQWRRGLHRSAINYGHRRQRRQPPDNDRRCILDAINVSLLLTFMRET